VTTLPAIHRGGLGTDVSVDLGSISSRQITPLWPLPLEMLLFCTANPASHPERVACQSSVSNNTGPLFFLPRPRHGIVMMAGGVTANLLGTWDFVAGGGFVVPQKIQLPSRRLDFRHFLPSAILQQDSSAAGRLPRCRQSPIPRPS
jgi:hypothetical protein